MDRRGSKVAASNNKRPLQTKTTPVITVAAVERNGQLPMALSSIPEEKSSRKTNSKAGKGAKSTRSPTSNKPELKSVEDGLKLVTEMSIQTTMHKDGWPPLKKESKENQILYTDRHLEDSAAAIPTVPLSLAIAFLVCNVLVPGLGTILGGFSYCCIATTHDERDRENLKTKIPGLIWTNLVIGISQFFTIPFLLVGWFWSLSWGVTMVYNALDRQNNRFVRPLVVED